LLAQVGRGVDQKPVLAVGADRDRRLRAAELWMSVAGLPAYLASAVPLRNTAACRGAQDDDAKHDPSPGTLKPSKYNEGGHRWFTPPRNRDVALTEVHLSREKRSCRRLITCA